MLIWVNSRASSDLPRKERKKSKKKRKMAEGCGREEDFFQKKKQVGKKVFWC